MNSISGFKAEFVDLIAATSSSGGCGLVVGSSYEWLVPHQDTARTSEFVNTSLALPDGTTVDVSGYVNSDSNLADVLWSETVLYTRLHGPVLAKSPVLADYFCGLLTGGKYSAAQPIGLDELISEAQAVARGERE